jgi:hypothetical protein
MQRLGHGRWKMSTQERKIVAGTYSLASESPKEL